MVENVYAFTYPPDHVTVWRFMKFAHLARLLQTSQLYFTRVTEFKDRFEGTVPPLSLKAYQERTAQSLREMGRLEMLDRNVSRYKEVIRCVRRSVYVSCWHMNSHESAAMWDLYTHGDDGVAIRCTVGDLRKSLERTPLRIYPASIVYTDFEGEAVPAGNLLSLVSYKRKSFEHEAEFRLVHWRPDIQQALLEGREPAEKPTHVFAEVELGDLLKHVYVSPLAPGWYRELVEVTLKQFGIECPCTQSSLYSDPI